MTTIRSQSTLLALALLAACGSGGKGESEPPVDRCAGVVCTAIDRCHLAGSCEPATGLCTAGAPFVCLAVDQCHDAGACDPATGICSDPPKADGTPCNDLDACTQTDACHGGACVGANPIACTAQDACHVAGTCDSLTGLCSSPAAPDGTACDDRDACTRADSCQAGACVGANPVICAAPDACHLQGACDRATGVCSTPPKPAGSSCSDGNACNGIETCDATGRCAAGTPPTIDDGNPCTVDACDTATGVVTHTPIAGCVRLPPDPATVATPLDPTGVTSIADATSFIYTGPNPVQTGVAPGTIDPKRVAVLRGKVTGRDGSPVPAVTITILGHAELGSTATRADGAFDIVVNGGGPVTISYAKDGYLPAQRQLQAPWGDFAWAEDVVLVTFDSQVTAVTAGVATSQVARAAPVTDHNGTRQATLIFPPGFQAAMTLPGGSTQPLSTLHVRATEYTVGASGPRAMPAGLPAASQYTYAVELSADEAVAAGATETRFDRPVPVYLENFMQFPVGMRVPAGTYDRARGLWVPDDDGRVVRVLAVAAGLADLDVDGTGLAADATALAALGISAEERQQVASLYAAGASLWRVPTSHFSPRDFNLSIPTPPVDAKNPPPPVLKPGVPDGIKDPCDDPTIGCEDQTLGEVLPVAGVPWALRYGSERVPGKAGVVEIPLVVGTRGSLQKIGLRVSVAGQVFDRDISPIDDSSTTFVWNGRDAYGRRWQGAAQATVGLTYFYPIVYRRPNDAYFRTFGLPGSTQLNGTWPSGDATRVQGTWTTLVSNWDASGMGLGGWTPTIQHAYDAASRTLLLGTGQQRRAGALGAVITRVTDGASSLVGPMLFAPDGSLYVTDTSATIYRRWPDGRITTAAGVSNRGFSGDGGPATGAALNRPLGIALGPDGSLYIADNNNCRIRKVDPAGIIQTIAGNGVCATAGDEGPATQAALEYPNSLAVGADGSIYVYTYVRVRMITPDGRIHAFAGTGSYSTTGDGGPALDANVEPGSVYVGPDGSVYLITKTYVRRVGMDGIISCFAACARDPYAPLGDGGQATGANIGPWDLAFGRDGTMFVSDYDRNRRIRRIGTDGVVSTLAGTGAAGDGGDGGLAAAAQLTPTYLAVAPDGTLYFQGKMTQGVGTVNTGIRRIAPPVPTLAISDTYLPAEDGSELYVFDQAGRHLRTLGALSGATKYRFGYTGGRLTSVTDESGNVTTVERSGAVPTAIVAPGGQRTALVVDADGWLTSLTNPAGESHAMTYAAGGLLTGLTDPLGRVYQFTYDTRGRLVAEVNPGGGSASLARTETSNGYSVAVTTALGRTRTFAVDRAPTGEVRRTFTDYGGAQTVTTLGADGSERTTHPDGTVETLQSGPDPRWGMLAPVATSHVLQTPGGLQRVVTTARTTVLSDPANALSLVRQTDAVTDNGATSTSAYEAATRTLTMTSAEGRIGKVVADGAGRVVQLQPDTRFAASTRTYDAKGRLASQTVGARTKTFVYDAANRLATVADATGATVTYAYDAADRITGLTVPSGRAFQVRRDRGGNPVQFVMPSGAVHAFSYTALDDVATYAAPGAGAAVTWQYDLDQAWTGATLPGGRTVQASYDPAMRATGRAYSDGSVSLSYADATERVSAVVKTPLTGPAQTVSSSYDSGLVTAASWSGAAQGQYTYGYDGRFELSSVNLTSGQDVVSVAIARDRDSLATAHGPFALQRTGPGGAPTQIGDGVLSVALGYDAEGRVSSRSHAVNGTAVFRMDLAYDLAGRIGRRTDTQGAATRVYDFAYDPDGQLVQVRLDGTAVESCAYDGNGNRTTAGAPATYDAQDRLVDLGGVSYRFDADGFLASRGGDAFAFSARGELLSAAAGGQTVTYAYDGLARRVARTLGASTVQYLYGNPENPFQVTAVRGATGQLTTLHYDEWGLLLAMERGGARYYVVTDPVGTPVLVVDAAGTVMRALRRDSWGSLLSDSNPAFELPIGFAGGLEDPVTGLVRFGLRDYDPRSGRWAARDPALYAGGQSNLYAYAKNDPVDWRDPAGLAVTVGAYGYDVIGGGGKLTVGTSGFSACIEFGFGFGGAFQVDPFASPIDGTGTTPTLAGDLGVALGPGKLGIGFDCKNKLNNPCPGKAGPDCVGKATLGFEDYSVGAKAKDGEVKGVPVSKKLKVSDNKMGISGKLAAGFCASMKF